MPNTEDIEAKLCAYVDGELDEAGRGEIERHLTTNPQHRKLIEELTQQRDMLRALPRARAPVDVAETLNAQLERSALLSEDDWRDQPIRLSRWPQIRAAAAVLLLVFGLAAVVYYVVPSPNQPNPNLVVSALPSVEEMRAGDAGARGGAATSPAIVPGGTVLTARGTPDRDFRVRSDQQLRALLALVTPEAHRDMPVSNAQSPQLQTMANAFAATPNRRARGEVKLIVAAADPDDAQRRVKEYLDERGIELEPRVTDASMPEPLSIELSQRVLASRRQQTTHVTMTERHKESAVIPDIPAGNTVEKDQLSKEAGAARSDESAQAPDRREQAYAARLPRRDVAELCRVVSSPLTGCSVRIIEDVGGESAGADASNEFPPVTIGNWSSLFPWMATSQADATMRDRRFSFAGAGASSDGDEVVEVLIVVRPDVTLQQQPQAPTDNAAAELAVPPTTLPAMEAAPKQ